MKQQSIVAAAVVWTALLVFFSRGYFQQIRTWLDEKTGSPLPTYRAPTNPADIVKNVTAPVPSVNVIVK